MIFGPVALPEALDAVLAHSIALPGGRLRKGQRLSGDDLERLRAAGHVRVVVARLEAQDLDEDSAALALARALVQGPQGAGLALSPVGTGRVNILAQTPGIARIDAACINAANGIDPALTVATVPHWHRMEPGGMLATVKVIPYAVHAGAVTRACDAARGGVSLAPPVISEAGFIETVLDRAAPSAADKGHRVTAERLSRLGVDLWPARRVPHDEESLARALTQTPSPPLILILTASATSDARDTAPQALRLAGGSVTHFGMPVDPGNLLFIGRLGPSTVIGLPGCARSPALNGADWVLERIVCGVPVSAADIQRMGVGGLLKEIPSRPRPRTRRS